MGYLDAVFDSYVTRKTSSAGVHDEEHPENADLRRICSHALKGQCTAVVVW